MYYFETFFCNLLLLTNMTFSINMVYNQLDFGTEIDLYCKKRIVAGIAGNVILTTPRPFDTVAELIEAQ